MNQEINQRLEQAAETAWGQDQQTNPFPVNPHAYVYGYKAGAQNILENPQEWDLFTAEQIVEQRNLYRGQVDKIIAEYDDLKSQLTEYRGALERALQSLQARRPHTPGLGAPINIIKSVLEQEVSND